jgi:hypothetical protein
MSVIIIKVLQVSSLLLRMIVLCVCVCVCARVFEGLDLIARYLRCGDLLQGGAG